MKLNETVDNMLSEDFKKRLLAEHQQTFIRYTGLTNMLEKWDKNELEFEPASPKSLLIMQQKIMYEYLAVLEARLVMEEVELSI